MAAREAALQQSAAAQAPGSAPGLPGSAANFGSSSGGTDAAADQHQSSAAAAPKGRRRARAAAAANGEQSRVQKTGRKGKQEKNEPEKQQDGSSDEPKSQRTHTRSGMVVECEEI